MQSAVSSAVSPKAVVEPGSSILSKPGHRKCASDTFSGLGSAVSGGSGGTGDLLSEDGDFDHELAGLFENDNEPGEGSEQRKSSGGGEDHEGEDDDPNDPKRAKRIMANRQSAQRSRMRKMQYISELEKSVTRLHTEISQLNPQVTFLRKKHQDLASHNRTLRERIAALMQETQYKDQMNAHLREEVMRLKRQREGGSEQAGPVGQQQPVPMLHTKPLPAQPTAQAPTQQQQLGSAQAQAPRAATGSQQPGSMIMMPANTMQQQQQQLAAATSIGFSSGHATSSLSLNAEASLPWTG
mmetsp:Transcript_21490/g.59714  ORF Transcript_21490/g.59714 Transcript_21490/m.59714 type:complete len:297 (+) Transcript_21490:323-1213(+)